MKRQERNISRRSLLKVSALAVGVAGLSMLPVKSAEAAENYDGAWGFAVGPSNLNVYSNAAGTSKIGTIYAYEGFTLLNWNGRYVEYSTPSGPKRGYLTYNNVDANYMDNTCVAMVNTTSTLYYGNNTSVYQASGTVYAGELVAVLAKNGDWVYVEYNTTRGRKRGYMLYSRLTCYNRPAVFPDLYNYNNEGSQEYVSGYHDIYSGPSNQYPIIGSINSENVQYFDYFTVGGYHESWYVEYNVTGTSQKKSGFVVW